MRRRRQKPDSSRLALLRDPNFDHQVSPLTVAGADYAVRQRLGEFIDLFLEIGARIVDLRDRCGPSRSVLS